jgi:hypothetical protein
MEADKTWKLQADKTWQKNAAAQVVLDSIFAALAAIWITVALGEEKEVTTWVKFFETVAALFSFLLFAISAEGTTTANDEHDVVKYVYYLLWYNVGVVLISAAIGLFVFERFESHFVHFIRLPFSCLSPTEAWVVVYSLSILTFIVLLWRWIWDTIDLVWGDDRRFRRYLKELEDEEKPEQEHGCVMRIIFCKRLGTER